MSDEESIESALRAADVLMHVAAQSVMEVDHIVTSPQLRVLVFIATRGPQNPGDVAVELGVHASNATRTSEKLVRLGLIERREDPSDRRYVRLSLTHEGERLVQRVIAHRRNAVAEVLAAMPPEEREAASRAFAAFAGAAGVAPFEDGRFTLVQPGAAGLSAPSA
ncbi:MarR family transcriptional regulator [Leifsonia shinshuensis]|uniref:MarR family winged helix-turn-helix transcriptional regulator n=1 Tax=Leifsonia shinshuensis TaxID=150026 RepID=UPI002863913A|nr:MarR family transcriptional regulator [Leifsonia shinshuensis]MDR6971799.1 DNA-binding MarR family transcriptional regulator [Leifsonia shinshuensis]